MIKRAKLGEVAPAKPLKKVAISKDTSVWHLNLDQIEPNSGRVLKEIVAPVANANGSTHWFDERHVLYSKLRPYLNKVVLPSKRGVATTELVPMMPDPKRLDRGYLGHYLKSNLFVNWVSGQVAGAKMPRVSMKVFWDHEIPLPCLTEQKRIAAILDKADAIRRKRQQAIELADVLLRVTFLDMFGDPLTNPKKFETAPLKEFGSVTTGNTPSRKVPEYYGNDIEWIKSDNINTPNHFLTKAEEGLSEIGKNKARIAPPNSTLVTCIAGSLDCIGNAAIANRKVAFNQQINAITPKKDTDPYFLYCLILNSKRKIQNASTNSMKGMVSKSKFENIVFFKPNFELQKQYGRIFQKHIETIYKFNRLMQCFDFLFRTLSQRAFRGEL